MLVSFYNLSLLGNYWNESALIFYWRPYDCILRLACKNFFFFMIYVGIQLTCLIFFQNWIWMVHATGRRQTINETKNSHLYRYIYKRVLCKESKNYLYIHRYYSVSEMAKNIYLFVLNRQRSYEANTDLVNYDQARFSNLSMASGTTENDSHENPFDE
jgi:hypothetical protein